MIDFNNKELYELIGETNWYNSFLITGKPEFLCIYLNLKIKKYFVVIFSSEGLCNTSLHTYSNIKDLCEQWILYDFTIKYKGWPSEV